MKKLIYISLFTIAIYGIVSCVDDYQDANPPRLKDGPFFNVSLSSDTIVGGNSFSFSINVIDAPGGVDSIAITNPQQLGSYSFDNLDAVRGNSKGEITGTYVSPTTIEGDFDLTFEVFDDQLDDKGEDASKSSEEIKTIYVKYPGDAPAYTVEADADTVIRGETRTITIDLTNAEGGVDTATVVVNEGEITDMDDLTALFDKESGTVELTYAADPEYVGEVELILQITDNLQQRTKEVEITFDAVYEFPAPTVELTIDDNEFKPYIDVDFFADITALGDIADITATSVEVLSSGGNGSALGTAMLDTTDVKEAKEETSAIVGGTFVSESKGFIKVIVSVTDAQGRSAKDSVEVLVLPCETADIAGTYTSLASGNSSSDPEGPYNALMSTVEITGEPGREFEVSDLSFGLFEEQDKEPEPGTIITCDDRIVEGEGENGAVTVTSGTINLDGTINIEWENEDGDTGSVLLTPN